jgi:ribonuclease P protein component
MLPAIERLDRKTLERVLQAKRLFCRDFVVYTLPLSVEQGEIDARSRFRLGIAFAKSAGKITSVERHALKRTIYGAFENQSVRPAGKYAILLMVRADYRGKTEALQSTLTTEVLPLIAKIS